MNLCICYLVYKTEFSLEARFRFLIWIFTRHIYYWPTRAEPTNCKERGAAAWCGVHTGKALRAVWVVGRYNTHSFITG